MLTKEKMSGQKSNKEKNMRNFKEEIIDRLVNDYGEYLYDFSLAELRLIENSNVFTLREARKEQEKLAKNK
jgi:hypothetical protein